MENSKSYVNLAVKILFGGIIGGIGSFLAFFGGEKLLRFLEKMGNVIYQAAGAVEAVLAVGLAALVIGIFIHCRRLWKKEEMLEDEEADRYGELFEHRTQIGITLADAGAMIMLLFAMLITAPAERIVENQSYAMTGSVYGIMVVGCVIMAVMEIMFYHMMQKRDPQKKGDPASLSFDRKWLESCDESEKMVIYQATYKAYQGTQVVLLIGVILGVIGKEAFGTGNFPLILVGTAWLVGTCKYNIWKLKGFSKRKESGAV